MLRRSIIGRIGRLHSQAPQVYFTAIGKVPSSPKRDRAFPPGQFFIARDFEYRGIVLLPQQVQTVSDDENNGITEVSAFIIFLIQTLNSIGGIWSFFTYQIKYGILNCHRFSYFNRSTTVEDSKAKSFSKSHLASTRDFQINVQQQDFI